MLENNKKTIDADAFIDSRRKEIINTKKIKSKLKIVVLIIFICSIIVSAIYFASSYSNIKEIDIQGNVYIKDEDILELSGIDAYSKYLLTFVDNVTSRIKKNQIIDSCLVEKLDDRIVKITIKEKKIIGYAFEDDNNVLILDDNSRIVLDKTNLYLIEKVPLIHGFSKEDILLLIKQLENVDYKMINEISEIHYYPDLKYQNIELIMRDGNYIFTSAYGLDLLNRYYDIDSSIDSDRNNCYYFEDISGNAYMSACPWEPEIEEIIEETNDVE